MAMGDEVNITSVPVTLESKCSNNKSSNDKLEFFSPEGVLKLEILNVPFGNLSYAVVASVTGTRIDLFQCAN